MRAPLGLALILTSLSFTNGASALEIEYTYEGLATCRIPPVTKWPIKGSGKVVVNLDRSSRVAATNGSGVRLDAKGSLGGTAIAVEGGSVRTKVQSGNRLQIVRDYPNNLGITDIQFTGKSCTASKVDQLKKGKSEYTFSSAGGFNYCSKPNITRVTCTVRD